MALFTGVENTSLKKMASIPLTSLPRIGQKKAEEFKKLGLSTVEDFVLYAPRAYDDRREERTIRKASIDDPSVNCRITVLSHSAFSSKKGRTIKVTAEDDDGSSVDLLCFNRPYLEKMLRVGTTWYLNGNVVKNYGVYQCSSFEIKKTKEECGIGKILPLYPLSGTLTQKDFRIPMESALSLLSPTEEILSDTLIEKYNLFPRGKALRELHFPEDENTLKTARKTLAFTELLLMEVNVLREKPRPSFTKIRETELEKKLLSSLPFELTDDQKKVLEEIRSDLSKKTPMERLLQGDVGSGKTLVAWLSALFIISRGGQVAFMAPTELLARQHAENAYSLLSPLGIRISYITGDVKGKSRRLLLEALKKGEIDLAIGTHSLFSEDVTFRDLEYVIIDEQHRFGVNQREALKTKGKEPHMLSMTATPIPRTLALTLFADMSVSTIKTMPRGRKSIITYTVGPGSRDKMYDAIAVEFERGHQSYFVYPRIDDEGESDLRDVMTMYTFLQNKYPNVPSAFIHSKLPEDEKMDILDKFRKGEIKYLVATSVVEVGIDIPSATCMVIEHADRFGLAALHQLRGRVGRSSLQSYCFLVFEKGLSEEAKERLNVMKKTNDGFVIAEKDLSIRGPGEIAGNKQSGFLKLRFASLTEDSDLVADAKDEAEAILSSDPGLISGINANLRRALKS